MVHWEPAPLHSWLRMAQGYRELKVANMTLKMLIVDSSLALRLGLKEADVFVICHRLYSKNKYQPLFLAMLGLGGYFF